jgi:hypothetical protein
VVTERGVSASEFQTLQRLHTRIDARGNAFGRDYEVSYIDRASLKRFGPEERRHPTVGADWEFCWGEHRANFVLERWTVREHGIVIVGPDPKTLIDPISADDLRAAVVSELSARVEDWAGSGEPPDWLRPLYYQSFEVETLCRALCMLKAGKMPTKPKAVEWALRTLPEPWRGLVEWSQECRADKAEDSSRIPEVMEFARWAAREAGTA